MNLTLCVRSARLSSLPASPPPAPTLRQARRHHDVKFHPARVVVVPWDRIVWTTLTATAHDQEQGCGWSRPLGTGASPGAGSGDLISLQLQHPSASCTGRYRPVAASSPRSPDDASTAADFLKAGVGGTASGDARRERVTIPLSARPRPPRTVPAPSAFVQIIAATSASTAVQAGLVARLEECVH